MLVYDSITGLHVCSWSPAKKRRIVQNTCLALETENKMLKDKLKSAKSAEANTEVAALKR